MLRALQCVLGKRGETSSYIESRSWSALRSLARSRFCFASLAMGLLLSGCVMEAYQPSADRSRATIIDSLRTHYCAEGAWPQALSELVDPSFSSRDESHPFLFDAGGDGLVLLQDGSQPDAHVATLLRPPSCDGRDGDSERNDLVTWASFAIPKGFTRVTSSATNDVNNNGAATRHKRLFELPGKHTFVLANLYGEEFSVSELERLKLSYEQAFPRVFKNVTWIRRGLELHRQSPYTVFIFSADQPEKATNTDQSRWVFVTLVILAGKQLFAMEAAAPLSQQGALESLVELVTASFEYERSCG
jgi:hypothetical protein